MESFNMNFFATTKRVAGAGLFAALIAMAPHAANAAWWNPDWSYRVKVDADAGPKGANIGDPIGRTQVLIRLHQGNFKFDTAKPDGSDIRFIAADDKTPLKFHIEKWDGLVDQVALIWVDVPDLAPSTVSNIFMYWGNDKAADVTDAKGTYDPDQMLVWHFEDENGLPKDSTALGNNALTSIKRDPDGLIGYGAKFDAATPPVKFAASPALNLTAGQNLTVQFWVKPLPATQNAVIYDQRDQVGSADLQIGLQNGAVFANITDGTTPVAVKSLTPLAADSWHLLTLAAGSGKVDLYADGIKVAEAAGNLPAISGAPQLGGAIPVAAPVPATPVAGTAAPAPAITPQLPNFTGQLDELEISKALRQPGAIALAFKAQGTEASLIGFETPEQNSGLGTGFIGIIVKSVTLDAWFVIGILLIMMVVSWLVMWGRAATVSTVSKANNLFRHVYRDVAKQNHADLLPPMPQDKHRALTRSTLFRIYDTGMRELNERLNGGRTKKDGSLTAQSLAAIRASMEATMVHEVEKLNNRMVILTICIAGGPFIGLLGTVVGVMITFAAIAAAGDVNVNSIAPGIAAALLATVTGLFVAIPALFGYNYFQVRIKSMITEMHVFVEEMIARLAEGNTQRQQAAE
jgi:biopolymer transport protein ExbB